jgi:hypothetical protein
MYDIPKQAIASGVKYDWLKSGGIWVVAEHPVTCIWYSSRNDTIECTAHDDNSFRTLMSKAGSLTLIQNKLTSTAIIGKDLAIIIDMLYDMSADEYFLDWKPIDIDWLDDSAMCYIYNRSEHRLYRIWLGMDSDKALAIDNDSYYELYLIE